MRIRTPGKIADGLWYLGSEEFCVYLLEGRNGSLLINGGVSCIVPQLLAQFPEFGIDETRINRFLILHSHFDHVGILPFFRRRYPNMKIHGSPRTLEILQKPKAVEAIGLADRYVTEKSGMEELVAAHDVAWREGITGEAVVDGDCIDLGDFSVTVIETPGHSPCSVSAYVPQRGALFPSDAGGIPNGDRIVTYGTSDFGVFEESLYKMRNLDLRYVCSDHCGYVTGSEAATYIDDAIDAAKLRRMVMVDTYRRMGSVDAAAAELAAFFRNENLAGMVPEETFREAHRQMVMNVTGTRRQNSSAGSSLSS